MRKLVIQLAAAVALAGVAQAQEAAPAQAPAAQVPAPSPEQVRAVWNYFEHGKGQGPILAEAKLCTEIAKAGPDKGDCTQEVPEAGVKANTSVYVWQAYMLPKDDEADDLTVQVKQGDTVRETKDVGKLKGTYWRLRNWTGVRLGKAGTWTISIMRGNNALKTFTVKVQ